MLTAYRRRGQPLGEDVVDLLLWPRFVCRAGQRVTRYHPRDFLLRSTKQPMKHGDTVPFQHYQPITSVDYL